MQFILASQSPRRKILLEKLNIDFKIIAPNIKEKNIKVEYESPSKYCIKLANEKCKSISKLYTNHIVIGADTIVYLNNKIFNKPKNKLDAINQLTSLSNNTHVVYTGVSIISVNKNIDLCFYDKTYVTFNKLSKYDIEHYISLHNPMDKSGSYGIQDWSAVFVKKINGCYNNVIGFPLSKFYKLCVQNKIIKFKNE